MAKIALSECQLAVHTRVVSCRSVCVCNPLSFLVFCSTDDREHLNLLSDSPHQTTLRRIYQWPILLDVAVLCISRQLIGYSPPKEDAY
jgi:hypothetical protein